MIITLKTDSRQIKLGILNTTRSAINSALHLAAYDIRRDIMNMIDVLMMSSPEYQSLLNGKLKMEFGLDNPEVALNDILNTLKQSVDVSVTPVRTIGNVLDGGINVVLLKEGIISLLRLTSVSYQGKNFVVPWLEWLLTQGDRIIIAGYHISYNLSPAQKRGSLTGTAIMDKGGGWRVPPEFSGTEESNWITRVFNPAIVKQHIDNIVAKNMQRRL